MKKTFLIIALTLFASPVFAKNPIFVQDGVDNNHQQASEYAASLTKYSGAEVGNEFSTPKNSSKKSSGSLGNYKKKHFNLYAVKDEIRLGQDVQKQQMQEFKKKGVAVDGPKQAALKARLERIIKKLAAVSDNPSLPYEVHIYDRKDIVNAFCLPGGKFGVFTGLFDQEKGLVNLNNDDQIAAVLGHEMAHASLRHITRRLTSLQGASILGSIASVAIGQGGGADSRQVFDKVFSLGMNLYMPSYSRKHEAEADRAGFYYMSKAGFNPQAAIDIWQRAAARGGKNSKQTDFFASHPASGERANTLKGWLPEAKKISGR